MRRIGGRYLYHDVDFNAGSKLIYNYHFVKQNTVLIPVADMMGLVSAAMILP